MNPSSRNALPPLLLTLLLAGCAVPPRTPQPPAAAPVEETAQPYDAGARVAVHPRHPRSVNALLTAAERQEAAGNRTAAAGSLERALRIEPRNARLWHRLAALRYREARYALAEQLALRSNAFAGGDRALKQLNQRLIEAARRARGDGVGTPRRGGAR